MAGVGAAAVVDVAAVLDGAVLAALRVDLDVPRGVVQPLDDLPHVGAGVLLRPVDALELQVRPVDKVGVHRDGEGVYRGGKQDLIY